MAIKKLGTIGVQVRIIPPDAVLPDHWTMTAAPPKAPRKPEIVVTDVGEEIEEDLNLSMGEEEFLEEQ